MNCGPTPSDHKKGGNAEFPFYDILLFKEELRLEIWKAAEQNELLDSFQLNTLPLLPIGQFQLTFDKKVQSLAIIFPNEFYQRKAFKTGSFQNLTLERDILPERFFMKIENLKIAKILIFPNDNRLGGELTPCFSCPHWMAEVYAFLNLKKKEYI